MVYNLTATTMKIAFISYWTCPLQKTGVLAAGGMNIYVLYLANSLGKLGINVDIFTPSHDDRDENIVTLHENIRIIHIKVNKINTVEEFSDQILIFIKKYNIKYNLIHAHYYYSGLVGIILKKILSVPLFVTFHSLGKTKELYSGIKNSFRVNAEKKVIMKASAIIASTELERKEIIENYDGKKGKISVVAPGVNHHTFRPRNKILSRLKIGIPLKLKTILFVGRIDPIKGVNFLIGAIAYLIGNKMLSENKFRLLIIGGDIGSFRFWQNPEVIKIKQLIAQNQLECCIKFIGSKPHTQLPYYYSASDVVVMPSLYESFGLVVLEAMACGSCVIASKAGGLKYLIKENVSGKFFEMGNISSLAKALTEVLNNRYLRMRLGKEALRESLNYCWDTQAGRMTDLYQKYI